MEIQNKTTPAKFMMNGEEYENAMKEGVTYSDTTPTEKKKRIIPDSVEFDWFTWAVAFFVIACVCIFAGYYSRDTSVQDRFDTISLENQRQAKLGTQLRASLAKEAEAKEWLKTNKSITVE